MSEENVEIVQKVPAAAARHDAARVFALYDSEVEWDNSTGLGGTGGGVYRGHEGLRHFFREWREAWEYPEEVPEELFDAGERVISVATIQNRGRTSGAVVEWDFNPDAGRSGRARSSGWRGSGRAPTPSKPPGCRSRR